MTATSPSPNPRRPTATAAFLRGVRRRASLLARLQCGSAARAAEAVDAAGRTFHAVASDRPMEQWPTSYWGALAAEPGLRAPAPAADWAPSLAWLPALANPVRAVLLLRLVARLEPDQIAVALAVPPSTVHAALREALPRQADGSHDAVEWQARQAALSEALDTLPEAEPEQVPDGPADRRHPPRRRSVPLLLWLGVALCAIALAASFLPFRAPGTGGQPLAEGTPLPPSEATPVEMDPDMALLAHPDLEQIAAAGDASVVRDLGFHAWYAARMAALPGDAASESGNAP